jgi:hypothetical protein
MYVKRSKFNKKKKRKGGRVAQRVSKKGEAQRWKREGCGPLPSQQGGSQTTQRPKIRMGRGAIRGLLIMPRNLAEEGFDDVLSDK